MPEDHRGITRVTGLQPRGLPPGCGARSHRSEPRSERRAGQQEAQEPPRPGLPGQLVVGRARLEVVAERAGAGTARRRVGPLPAESHEQIADLGGIRRAVTLASNWTRLRATPAADKRIAIVLANSMREKFGGDSLTEMRRNFDAYLTSILSY